MASSPGFDEAARLLQRSGLFYRARLCPLSGISGSGDSSSLTLLRLMYPHWEHNMELILDWLENTPQVKTVFIHNRWIELVNNHRDTRLKQLVADGLRHTCARLRKAGKQIVLLGHGTFHKNGRWQAEDGGQLMYCDDNHLSPYGAKKMVGGIIDQLFPGMERTAAN